MDWSSRTLEHSPRTQIDKPRTALLIFDAA
jgi:hypothetical protein